MPSLLWLEASCLFTSNFGVAAYCMMRPRGYWMRSHHGGERMRSHMGRRLPRVISLEKSRKSWYNQGLWDQYGRDVCWMRSHIVRYAPNPFGYRLSVR